MGRSLEFHLCVSDLQASGSGGFPRRTWQGDFDLPGHRQTFGMLPASLFRLRLTGSFAVVLRANQQIGPTAVRGFGLQTQGERFVNIALPVRQAKISIPNNPKTFPLAAHTPSDSWTKIQSRLSALLPMGPSPLMLGRRLKLSVVVS